MARFAFDFRLSDSDLISLTSFKVTEPFICPSLYEKYVNKSDIVVVDEWTLALAMGKDLASEMETHYKTFIVRL